MADLMIKIDNVSKQYRLGIIGGGTLQGDLQTWWALKHGREDPNSKIGSKVYARNEKFLALDGVSFEVKKGERVGIIGHNGAGKSTLLKLLSRVTAPTEGTIYLNGRVASMLEVGTGFHGELTGRENIYMNGAILGMTKAEIDAKMEDIIEFSEVRQFIDTPVKRYSSGMYVKLAFSVAAHLDSEIIIMDEVLAVGDMAFQKKCIDKMNEVSRSEGRTILYVSHNMNTIRQLCDRVVVLDHGKVVFNGAVEEGIALYLGRDDDDVLQSKYVLYDEYHHFLKTYNSFLLRSIEILNEKTSFVSGEVIQANIEYYSKRSFDNLMIRFETIFQNGQSAGTALSSSGLNCNQGKGSFQVLFKTDHMVDGIYKVNIITYQYDEYGNELFIDGVYPGFYFEIKNPIDEKNKVCWLSQYWGPVRFEDIQLM